MKRIGIFSGSFDPPTNGHLWIIQEASKLFDELHVVIGPNPGKQPTFPAEERLRMLKACNVQAEILKEKNIVEYARKFEDATLIRGLRDYQDLLYEQRINTRMGEISSLTTIYLTPSDAMSQISSSHVKDLWLKDIPSYSYMVPPEVVERMCAYKNQLEQPQINLMSASGHNWIVAEPEVASIFETTTAGFGMTPAEPTVEVIFFGKMKNHFEQMVEAGLIKYEPTISWRQVRDMLEPFPVDLVQSETFHLAYFPLDKATPTGERYLPCSQSLGPVIVDVNHWKPELGPNLVIEGKHRWLDAIEDGKENILAWVGDQVQ